MASLGSPQKFQTKNLQFSALSLPETQLNERECMMTGEERQELVIGHRSVHSLHLTIKESSNIYKSKSDAKAFCGFLCYVSWSYLYKVHSGICCGLFK